MLGLLWMPRSYFSRTRSARLKFVDEGLMARLGDRIWNSSLCLSNIGNFRQDPRGSSCLASCSLAFCMNLTASVNPSRLG
jgi:hypothetical protein